MRGAYGVLKSKALDEVSNTVPPLSPMVHLTWVNGGRREVLVPEGLALPGTTLTGSLKPTYVDTSDDAGTYEQGSKVDVQGYYDAVEATLPIKCASPDVQAKAALKYRSHIINGDKFYFAGSHNYVTSNQEVYSPENALNREVPEESFMSVEGRSHWRERDLKVAHGDGSLFSPLLRYIVGVCVCLCVCVRARASMRAHTYVLADKTCKYFFSFCRALISVCRDPFLLEFSPFQRIFFF